MTSESFNLEPPPNFVPFDAEGPIDFTAATYLTGVKRILPISQPSDWQIHCLRKSYDI
jgi:hypothetical protein